MRRPDIVVVGVSAGGLTALCRLFGGLPVGFSLPVVVAQHRSADSGEGLMRALRRCTTQEIREPQDKDVVEPGRIYVAPSDYHLLVDDGLFWLSTDAPVLYARPSIDVLFESAADFYGDRALCVVLTGASADGAAGAARILQGGGTVLVQDPEEAEYAVMPRAAIRATGTEHVLRLAHIGDALVRFCRAA